MIGTMTQFLSGIGDRLTQRAVRNVVGPMVSRFGSCALNTAGLVIKTGGSTLAKTGGSDCYLVASGIPLVISSATDMPALTGLNITAGSYNVFCFFVDAAGTKTVLMGIEGTTLAGVKFPQFPSGKALIGYLIVTYASAFVGGTTPLDTATTVYVNPVGPFDPTIQL